MSKLKSIHEDALQLSAQFEEGIKWAQAYIKDESTRDALIKSVGPSSREVRRVVKATLKRPSIAIFGQSQVGKSYLVQNLTKNPRTSRSEYHKDKSISSS